MTQTTQPQMRTQVRADIPDSERAPARARRDGKRVARLRAGAVCWLAIVVCCLAAAGLAATGARTGLGGDSRAPVVPEAGTLQVSGAGTTKSLPCHAGYLSVSGKDNTVTLTGHCTSVSVSGNGNRIAVDSSDAVSAAGAGNVVVYHWGSPKVVNAGSGNVVRQG
ncbi:DUF3060 domain-containing protein [Mycobacterium avium]